MINDKTKQKVDKNKTNQNMTVNRLDWSVGRTLTCDQTVLLSFCLRDVPFLRKKKTKTRDRRFEERQ